MIDIIDDLPPIGLSSMLKPSFGIVKTMPILKHLLRVLVGLPAILFITMGLRWLVDPAGIAPELGLTLETGLGLSTQVGDLSAFFLTIGLCILMALATGRRLYYYPAISLLLLAAIGRMIAWLVHGADLAVAMIAPEIIISLILITASRILPEKD